MLPSAAHGQGPTPAESAVEPLKLFSIEGAAMGTLQGIATGDVKRGAVFGSASVDVALTVRPTGWLEVFLDVEVVGGPGPDQFLGTLSRLNNDADRLDGWDKRLVIRELLLRFSWLDGRVRLHVGKLDPNQYFDRNAFAGDERTQFLSTALVQSPAMGVPPNGPGAVLSVHTSSWWSSFGVFAPDDVDRDLSGLPFMIAEVGRRNVFALEGSYAMWAGVGSVREDRDRVGWGTGITLDQFVAPGIGVFLRGGILRQESDDRTYWAWSTGVQLTPTWIGRPKDTLGLGYSDQRLPQGRERFAEVYYRFTAARWLHVIPNVQWILSGPNTVTGGTNRNVVVPGLRALLTWGG